MSATSLMPERIGRFHVQAMLGRGAMGVVYRGHDEEIDRLVAIKLIRADLLDTEDRENYLRRFRNEARIAGRCIHANIVSLYDFALHDGNPYLVMEYVNGAGLQQAIPRNSKRPVREVLPIALQVLDALQYAHRCGIVHRDIKPANILLTRQSTLKITDFGISRLVSMELTAMPLLIGTPSYMSPQQCRGVELDGRSDLFSLGCVLYELLAGERPFTGVSYTDTIFNIINTRQKPLSTLRDDLPDGLSEAIDRALAKNADERYDDAGAFASVLRNIADEQGETSAHVANMIMETRLTHACIVDPVKPSADSNTTLIRPQAHVQVPPAPDLATIPAERAIVAENAASVAAAEPVTAAASDVESTTEAGTRSRNETSAPLESSPASAADIPADVPLQDSDRRHITACLAEIIGPIAPMLVSRAERPDLTREALVRDCAAHVRHDNERVRFLVLVSHPVRTDRGRSRPAR